VSPEQEAGVLRAVHACLVHNTLTHTPEIETLVRSAVTA